MKFYYDDNGQVVGLEDGSTAMWVGKADTTLKSVEVDETTAQSITKGQVSFGAYKVVKQKLIKQNIPVGTTITFG